MSDSLLKNIDGLLIDLDGVVYISNAPIPGAADAIARLKSKNIPLRFVTNTTTKSLESLHQKLTGMGLPIERHEIISAVLACVIYLRTLGDKWRQVSSPDASLSSRQAVRSGDLTALSRGRQTPKPVLSAVEGSAPPTVFLVLTDDCKKDFAEFTQTDQNPDYVVIGDLELKEGGWTYDLLNKIFNLLIGSSKLIALHKGKFWQTDEGLTVDIGLFVAGLEYVTGQAATVIGKPSKTFFEMALKDLGVPASRVAMIGDDLDNDIAGAQNAGIGMTILVKTGKYREELVKKSKVKADFVIDSLRLIK